MTGWLGYSQVPKGQVGWDGYWGTIAVQGPAPRPEGWVDVARQHEIAEAEVTTEWTCPFCDSDNRVYGEGAVFSWMECSECGHYAWLVT